LTYFRYIKFYGYKFSKADHVSLVKALFSVVILPNLEPWLVNKTGER
jgi:hypothetical protein